MPDNRLSLAASNVLAIREHAWKDYVLDGSGECGPLIHRHHLRMMREAVEAQGYTVEEYNKEVRHRLTVADEPYSYRISRLLDDLEIEED